MSIRIQARSQRVGLGNNSTEKFLQFARVFELSLIQFYFGTSNNVARAFSLCRSGNSSEFINKFKNNKLITKRSFSQRCQAIYIDVKKSRLIF